MERARLNDRERTGGYFTRPHSDMGFISSGSKLLDLALGGGWAEDRICNIVGDKSTGKTLLCIEAAANFAIKYPRGRIKYREAEAAFLRDYAEALGMPMARVDFGRDNLETVEDLFNDLTRTVNTAKPSSPTLYIVDSLDALSDREELDRDIDAGSYGAKKAKTLSQMFRRLTKPMAEARVSLMLVSQIRDKIGISFGRKTMRAGGRAMDFYCSQVAFLSQLGLVYKTISKIKRPIGVEIRAKVDKNKVGLPFREAQFQIQFGYGIEDEKACADWLHETGYRGRLPESRKELHALIEREWFRIEKTFLPAKRKYST